MTVAEGIFPFANELQRTEEEPPACTAHVDDDGNNLCDNCGADVTPQSTPCTHVDANKDFKCDLCSEELPNNGLILSETVLSQMEEAEFFKLDIEMSSVDSYNSWGGG